MLKDLKNIEHLGIYTHNAKKLTDWYCDVLGLKITHKLVRETTEKSIYFLRGTSDLVIEILPTDNNMNKRELYDPGYSHIAIIVENFEKAEEYLKSKGIILDLKRKTGAGWTIGYFHDPDGNIIEIVYRPRNEKI
jgi:catechol 2,3-dioxygenase-like lactoylglutathione lyase family enzyme